jgi:putative aldouronate transport system permease protein
MSTVLKASPFQTNKSKIKSSFSRKVFMFFNVIALILIALSCILPFLNLLAISFSERVPVMAGDVGFWPVGFNTNAYAFILSHGAFWDSVIVSFRRIGVGIPVNLVLIVLTAYPLSKSTEAFRGRTYFAWFFIVTMLFSGGLIPTLMVVRAAGLFDSVWSLVLPGALPVFSMLIVMNFMRSLPRELEEAAYIDGANHIQTLLRVILPVSTPTLATVTLFSFVGHWNSWLDGMIYMTRVEHYPLQTYLRTVVVNPEVFFRNAAALTSSDIMRYLETINARTSTAAQLFLATIPILAIYPFLQKYFTTGLVLGSVKG